MLFYINYDVLFIKGSLFQIQTCRWGYSNMTWHVKCIILVSRKKIKIYHINGCGLLNSFLICVLKLSRYLSYASKDISYHDIYDINKKSPMIQNLRPSKLCGTLLTEKKKSFFPPFNHNAAWPLFAYLFVHSFICFDFSLDGVFFNM